MSCRLIPEYSDNLFPYHITPKLALNRPSDLLMSLTISGRMASSVDLEQMSCVVPDRGLDCLRRPTCPNACSEPGRSNMLLVFNRQVFDPRFMIYLASARRYGR